INTIGEGANEVLKAFIAVVGCKGPGLVLKGLLDDLQGFRWGLRTIGRALGVGVKMYTPWLTGGAPEVPVRSPELTGPGAELGRLVREFGLKLPHVFKRAGDEATFAQAELVHERIADVAIDLYVSACVLSRLDSLAGKAGSNGRPADPTADPAAGRHFLDLAFRRIRANFAALDDNDDPGLLAAAKNTLAKF
ncbi:MAG: acyl-CoA dehydrogenase, partial [Gemmataceae bacterium]|nr:acyl-CoA dehydrogenase [Gemmataceae bacterium]